VRLFLIGDRPLEDLLAGDDLPTDIARTASRLSLLRRLDPVADAAHRSPS
jgi:hypothetical protein